MWSSTQSIDPGAGHRVHHPPTGAAAASCAAWAESRSDAETQGARRPVVVLELKSGPLGEKLREVRAAARGARQQFGSL